MKSDVIIIGGGIAGLACAMELSHRGLLVTVLEKGSELGGRARSWSDSHTGDTVDIGPHILLTEYRNMLRLMSQLGTRHQIVWQHGKFITLVDNPHPVDIRMHRLPAPFHFLPSLLSLPQISIHDLVSNKRLLWRVMRLTDMDVAELDDITAEDYLREMGVSAHFIDWFWRSACLTILNAPLEKCSAGALLRFFRFMVGKSGYQVGFAAAGLAELFSPAKARIEAAGGQVLLDTEVMAITGTGRVDGIRLADGTDLQADCCVATIPPQQLHPVLPEHWRLQTSFSKLAYFEPSPYVSLYLWFDRKLTHEQFWARVWAPDNLNYDFYDLSNIRLGWTERPSVIASNIVCSHRAAGMSDEEIIQTTLRELTDFLPQATRAELRHAQVHRIPMAVPLPLPGSEKRRPPQETPVAGLYLAGDWTATGMPCSMESAVRSGYLAAEKILAERGTPEDIAMPLPTTEGLVRMLAVPRGS